MAQTQEIVRKEPSRRLIDAVDNCANAFEKTAKAVTRAIEIGKQEEFSPKEVGDMIRQRLLKAGFSSRTVRRYLPQEAKQQQQVHSKKVAKMSTYHQELELEPEQYDSQALESYDKSFLIQIIRYLEQRQTIKQVAHGVKTMAAAKHYYSPQLDANSPRQVCVNQCLTILQEKQALTFEDLIKQACQQSKQAAAYIGDKYQIKHNIKLRPIMQQLLEHDNVSRTGQHPIVLTWV